MAKAAKGLPAIKALEGLKGLNPAKWLKDLNSNDGLASLQWLVNRVMAPAILIYVASADARFTQPMVVSWMFALFALAGVLGITAAIRPQLGTHATFSVVALSVLFYLLPGFRLPEIVGAYLVVGVVATLLGMLGLVTPVLGKVGKYLPPEVLLGALAGAMLQLEVVIFPAFSKAPLVIGPALLAYVGAKKLTRGMLPALGISLVVAITLSLVLTPPAQYEVSLDFSLPTLMLLSAEYRWQSLVSLGIPLLLVTLGAFSPSNPGLAAPPGIPALKNGVIAFVTGMMGGYGLFLKGGTPSGSSTMALRLVPPIVLLVMAPLSGVLISLLRWIPIEVVQALAILVVFPLFMQALVGALTKGSKMGGFMALLISASSISWFGVHAFVWALAAGIVATYLSDKQQ